MTVLATQTPCHFALIRHAALALYWLALAGWLVEMARARRTPAEKSGHVICDPSHKYDGRARILCKPRSSLIKSKAQLILLIVSRCCSLKSLCLLLSQPWPSASL